MSCTCRTLAFTARQATAQAARSRVAVPVRSFTSSSLRAAAAQVATQEKASPAFKTSGSSCPAGTVLKGLNYLKDASDPVAMEDSEYPSWVWQLGQPDAPVKSKKVDVETRLRAEKKELKRQRKAAIKARNALKG